jgi:hypothetical protein
VRGLITEISELVLPKLRVQFVDADDVELNPQDEETKDEGSADKKILALFADLKAGCRKRCAELKKTADLLNVQIKQQLEFS